MKVKRWHVGVTAAGFLAAAVAYSQVGRRDAFDNMTFSPNFHQVRGDKNGVVCWQGKVCSDGKCSPIVSDKMLEYDFRGLDDKGKERAVIVHARKALKEAGLACVGPDGVPFLDSAYAQTRHNPGGGGCSAHSCDAHVVEGGSCELNGTDCVVTVMCCPGCPEGCAG